MAFRSKNETGDPRAYTQPSGAYWAARLIERKRAEEALQAEYDRLTRRVDQQASQLEVLSETLRRERAESEHLGAVAEQLQFRLQRADGEPSGTSADDWSARLQERERVEESLRAEFVEVRQQIEQQAAEIRRLNQVLERESSARARSEAQLEEAKAELLRRAEERQASASEDWAAAVGEQTQVIEAFRAELEEAKAELLRRAEERQASASEDWAAVAGEQTQAIEAFRAELVRVGQEIERQTDEITRLDEAVIRESSARERAEAALQRTQATLRNEISQSTDPRVADQSIERKHWEETQRETLAQVTQLADAQGAELRLLQERLNSEVAGREHSEGALQKKQSELELRIGEAAGRLEGLTKRLDDSGVEREHLDNAIRQVKVELEQRTGETAGRLEGLSKRLDDSGAEREHLEKALRQVKAELEQRTGETAGRLEGLSKRLDDSGAEREHLDNAIRQVKAELEQRIGEAAGRLEGLSKRLDSSGAEREHLDNAIRQVKAELEQRIGEAAGRLEGLSKRLDGSGAERERLEKALRQVRAKCERHSTENGAMLRSVSDMLEREISERRDSHNSLHELNAESARRVGEYIAELRSMSESLGREVDDRKSMEASLRQAQVELDRHLAGQAAELGAIKGAVAREISERKDLGAGLERLEKAQVELGRRMDDRTPPLGEVPGEPKPEAPQSLGGELALRQSNELAELTRRGNGALVATVGPEICVPINGIICMTDLALDTDLTDAQRDYLERVKSLAEAMLAAVNGGRGLGEGDLPQCDLERVAFGLREHLRDTLKPLLLRAHQKGLELSCHIAPKVPNGVLGHPASLRQVLVNLVGNAIKFTEGGEVSVCVDTASQTTSEAVLLVTVADGGAGIPVAQQGAVFDAMAGGRDGIEQAEPTPGLGLAVSSELVRTMGGRIWFESEVDHGTSFRFTIRLGLQDESESRPAWALWRGVRRRVASRAPSSRKDRTHEMVLLAEDDPGDRSVLKHLLEERGYAAITVEDGRGVLAAMENDWFDLVIMDLRMPGMDAFEAAAAIRALESGNGGQTPIIVLAGDATEGDRRRCLAVGIDAWVTKPIRAANLFAAVEPLISNTGPREDYEQEEDYEQGED